MTLANVPWPSGATVTSTLTVPSIQMERANSGYCGTTRLRTFRALAASACERTCGGRRRLRSPRRSRSTDSRHLCTGAAYARHTAAKTYVGNSPTGHVRVVGMCRPSARTRQVNCSRNAPGALYIQSSAGLPTAYNDMDDQTLYKRILAKYPNCELPQPLPSDRL
jgi:hypothetical protein